ncbi:hypothetical protein [Streptomyces sp. NPDC060031]|uniref:hypothetical protein n=1 Tax=Streptomyces sp. NPDC060031 TaxID=3347043 RepID=UPI0036AFA3EF
MDQRHRHRAHVFAHARSDALHDAFYRAIMNLNGEPEHAFGTLVVRDGRIWRRTAGFGG